jgi:hypothetical protein
VATYRAIGPSTEMPADAIRTELPHLRLDLDPRAMTPEEKAQAAAALRAALACLGQTDNPTE